MSKRSSSNEYSRISVFAGCGIFDDLYQGERVNPFIDPKISTSAKFEELDRLLKKHELIAQSFR